MADNSVNVSEQEINLNTIVVGKRTLRYMYLCLPDIVSTKWDDTKQCMPLFLASDVLVDCNIVCRNLPRLHAKHAKRGLATKLLFPVGVRIRGIHGTTRGVWFYSVQGLFKIAFDLYCREDQHGCLFKLQQLWQQQFMDPILKPEVQVRKIDVRERDFAPLLKQPSIRTNQCEMNSHPQRNKVEILGEINTTLDNYLLYTCDEPLEDELRLLKTYVSLMNLGGKSSSFVERTVTTLNSCLELLPKLSENSSDFSEKEAILCEVARWLGTEFASYQSHVNEGVTCFKQKHISSIENLPCAEVLVKEVFPESMQVLLQCWLQLECEERANVNTTDDSTSLPKTLFPIVQIVLELANQTLLSGVAHVLYSRLIHSDVV